MWLTGYIAQNLKDSKSEYPNFGDFESCLWKFKWIVSGIAKSSIIERELIDEERGDAVLLRALGALAGGLLQGFDEPKHRHGRC